MSYRNINEEQVNIILAQKKITKSCAEAIKSNILYDDPRCISQLEKDYGLPTNGLIFKINRVKRVFDRYIEEYRVEKNK